MVHTLWIAFGLFAATPSNEGPDLFKEKKCVKCHSVSVAQIEAVVEDDEDEDEEDKKEPTDLSTIGDEMDATAIKTYLERKSKRDGKKHKKKFSGSPEDMETTVSWLASLKS